MSLIITDEVLENLTCSTCHKFLSVPPIKVYPSRKIRCGRCSEDGDAGVHSLFDQLANECFFKCVNRFDGCRELLNYSKVRDHESECTGKSYLCPICPISTMVPTFLMIPHFQKQHKNMYIDIPSVFFEVNGAIKASKFFLYKQKDTLFIVIFKTDSSIDYILMSAMLLGDQKDAQNMLQRFTLRTGEGLEIHSREKPCAAFDLSKDYGIHIEKSEIITKCQGSINVTFKINTVVAGLIKLPGKYSSSTKQADQTHNHLRLRYIHLNDNFQKSYPEFSIASDFTSLVKTTGKIKSEIVLCCWNCSLLSYCYKIKKPSNIYVARFQQQQKYYLLCYPCFYYKNDVKSAPDILSKEAFNKVLFFCFWKCGKFFNVTSLNEHEINCCLQPPQKCPVKYCQYENKLFDIKQHLMKVHSPEFAVLDYKSGEIELNLTLVINASPMKYFIPVKHEFVLMKFVWIEPQWEISIFKCNPNKKDDDGLKAVALIYETANILSSLKQGETAKICHRETVKIKCYFTKRE